MKKKLIGFVLINLAFSFVCYSQVDTTYIYSTNNPFGTLDVRIAKSATNYYYLQEGQTFSFRGTNTFFDMTAWDSSPYREGHLREKTSTADNFIMNYRLLVPDGYNPTFEEGYPIIIMLHGYGERGNCEGEDCYHGTRQWSPVTNTPPAPVDPNSELLNNDHNLLHGAQKHYSAMQRAKGKLPGDETLDPKAFPGFVLFPQNLNGWDPGAVQDALRILRLVLKKYNIDEDRVYIEGLSNGGQGVYEAIKRAPWLFASAIAMSPINDAFIHNQKVAHRMVHIPLWVFQGGMDINPYPSKTVRSIQQFRAAGADVRYTLYPEIGHGTWNKAFGEPDFFSWMLGKNKSDIHSFQGSTFICSDEGNRLELAKGFKAYQWEFNGKVIAGADSSVFYAKQPGSYRARFARVSNPTEAQWNQWSKPLVLTATAPPQAKINQIGTTLLKDLNGKAEARLESAEEHGHYYWYKDGVLLDLPGLEDDTLRLATIGPSHGNGAYTLIVADQGCSSEPSVPKYIFFEDSAPLNITAPTDFAGISASAAENSLTWKDVSTNEGGFEIWRRRKINGTSFSPWEMVGLTAANATTFDDTTVEPTVSYQYKIRAVSNTGRSEYLPAGPTEGLVVETVVDTQAPAAPIDLKATGAGIQNVRLTWKPSTDNTRIREYHIYYNGDSVFTGSADTTFVLTDLALNTNYEFTVRGVDLSKNYSAASNIAKASTYYSGLYYEHTTGSWSQLDSIDWTWAEFTGHVSGFTLAAKTQEDYYNFSFDGYLLIEGGGNYEFRVTSSDGSRLYIDNALVVNNDGLHDVRTAAGGPVSLAAGPHRIYLQYFEHTGKDSLSVEYKGADTGNSWTLVTRDVLKSDPNVVTAIGDPDNGPEDSFIVSVFPNPATQNNIRVMVETVIPAAIRVQLLDLTGSNLFESTFLPEEIVQGVSVTPAGVMNTGLYLIVVEQGGIVVRKKVLIRRE